MIQPGSAAAGPCLLVITRGVVARHLLPIDGEVLIGRAEDCAVRVDDASVSRKHVRLRITRSIVSVEDAGSANGTFVRRASAARARLGPGERKRLDVGDVVEVGAIIVVLWRADDAVTVPEGTVPPEVVVSDPAMQQLYTIVRRVAHDELGVVLSGESGVGKALVAETVHRLSPRGKKPFLRLHCEALDEVALEIALFGQERFAGSGAAGKAGVLEAANGGTVFLDEVAELPDSLQVKLLHALEDGALLRVGGSTVRRIDVRIVCASHRDLEAEASRGTFRSDLYFRLAGITLTIPPLRARKGEIEEIARRFVAAASARRGRPPPRFTDSAREALLAHAWPGNIRELRTAIDRAVVLASDELRAEHLLLGTSVEASAPSKAASKTASTTGSEAVKGGELRPAVDAFERKRIVEALERCGGNQTRAAKLLGISRRTLTNRLNEHGLPRPIKR